MVKDRYARMTLARVVKRHRIELGGRIEVPAKDAELPKFYDCAERIMTKVSTFVRGDDLYFLILHFFIRLLTNSFLGNSNSWWHPIC